MSAWRTLQLLKALVCWQTGQAGSDDTISNNLVAGLRVVQKLADVTGCYGKSCNAQGDLTSLSWRGAEPNNLAGSNATCSNPSHLCGQLVPALLLPCHCSSGSLPP